MKTSCVTHPENHPLIIVRKWQVEFCDGDVCAAALMSFFEYWHNIKLAMQPRTKHQNDVAEHHGEDRAQDESLWQWHTAEQIEAGVMVYKRDKIRAGIKTLEKKGVIQVGNNPNERYKFDRTKFFLFNPDICNAWLRVHYPFAENRKSSTENRNRSTENQSPDAENQQAITETSSENSAKREKKRPTQGRSKKHADPDEPRKYDLSHYKGQF